MLADPAVNCCKQTLIKLLETLRRVSEKPPLRLYEKASRVRQLPQHEEYHGSVHERFAARTQPLMVSKLLLRLWQIQARERSTTQRRGRI